MEGGESPLEVLSRAATMLQENSMSAEDASKQSSKQLPTTKWKRDRRSRLPEYSRKSDPKIAETFGSEAPEELGNQQENAPLDMSVRQRGLPPSYSQTINNPEFRSNYRPSVIQNSPPPTRDDIPPGISMCDPIIDEHFRRSLGNDYLTLFANNNVAKENNTPVPVKAAPKAAGANVIELMDTAGLSVDDHFAKALGDTWVKLNKKEEIKNNDGLVTI